MVTRAKAAIEVDRVLSDSDYDAIIAMVPLRSGADRARLKDDIRGAAISYVEVSHFISAAEGGPTKRELRAPYIDAADKLEAARAVLLPLASGPPHPYDPTWRNPIEADIEALDRLIHLARRKANQHTARRGRKPGWVAPAVHILMTAWKEATGRSALTMPTDNDFLAFARALTARLCKAGYNVAAPSRRQMRAAPDPL
jgi:hypothetical protein